MPRVPAFQLERLGAAVRSRAWSGRLDRHPDHHPLVRRTPLLHHARRAVLTAAALVSLTGCTAAVSTTVPPTATPRAAAPTAAATDARVTTAPAATTTPSQSAAEVRASFVGELPDGWTVAAEGRLLAFATAAEPAMTIELLPNRSVMAEDCSLEAEPGVASTASAITDELAARKGVLASAPGALAIGGLDGRALDIRVDPSTGVTCPTDEGGFVPLFGSLEAYGWGFAGVAPEERIRIVALDVPGGGNLLILVTAPDAATFDQRGDDVTAILDHLVFEVAS